MGEGRWKVLRNEIWLQSTEVGHFSEALKFYPARGDGCGILMLFFLDWIASVACIRDSVKI